MISSHSAMSAMLISTVMALNLSPQLDRIPSHIKENSISCSTTNHASPAWLQIRKQITVRVGFYHTTDAVI